MIIDLKTHIYSLVAVFLALGIGILLGVGLGGTLNSEQKSIIKRLEDDFNHFIDEKKVLQLTIQQKNHELEMQKQFNQSTLSYLVHDHLLGRKIAIIKTCDLFNNNITKEIVSTLELAGAKVVSITHFRAEFPTASPEQQSELAATFQVSASDPAVFTQEVMKKVSEEIILGLKHDKLNYLQEKDFVRLWGSYNQPVDTVIVLGGAMDAKKNFVSKLDIPLLTALKKFRIYIIGGEPFLAGISYIPHYKRKGIVTVDNVDTIPGQVAMVYALSKGLKNGSFGFKETARSILPEL